MTRREIEKHKMKEMPRIAQGFSQNMSNSEGIVLGGDNIDQGGAGAMGMVVPWQGCKHIKIVVGTE